MYIYRCVGVLITKRNTVNSETNDRASNTYYTFIDLKYYLTLLYKKETSNIQFSSESI